MAVQDFGTVRIVSFLLTRTTAVGAPAAFGVVDVWAQSDGLSVLKVRYAAARGSASEPVPGEVRQPQIEKRF
jgi:hypothetical protein